MKIQLATALISLQLTGCGLSIGPENAVENTTVAELFVYPNTSRNESKESIEQKIDYLREIVPFNVDTDIGEGISECEDISNFEVTSQSLGESDYRLTSKIRILDKFDAKLDFVTEALELGPLTLFNKLYFIDLSISNDSNKIYSGGADSETTVELIRSLFVDCSSGDILSNYVK